MTMPCPGAARRASQAGPESRASPRHRRSRASSSRDADRAQRIIDRRTTTLRNRSEQELAGDRDAQDYLFREDWRPLNAGLTPHLHRLLFAHTSVPGGAFKTEDNLVVDRSPDGSTTVRFKPVSAASTPSAIDDLIGRYQDAVAAGRHHPVLVSGLFILDLLVIHPFKKDGNGRVARLLTGAMLSEHSYTVGRYVSLEQAVAESADAYYQALLDSTHGWHEGTADPWPWLGYFTSVIAGAYAVFADRAASGPDSRELSSSASTSTSCAMHRPRFDSQISGRQCQVSVTRRSGSSWSS